MRTSFSSTVRELMYMKGNTAHCIVFDANGSDGILVEAEGADYARKSQFVPNARAIIETNLYYYDCNYGSDALCALGEKRLCGDF